jgi:hypothetical protein
VRDQSIECLESPTRWALCGARLAPPIVDRSVLALFLGAPVGTVDRERGI